MSNGSLPRWLMIGALGAGLVIGCDRSSPRTVTNQTPSPAANPQTGYGGNTYLTQYKPVAQPGRAEVGMVIVDRRTANVPDAHKSAAPQENGVVQVNTSSPTESNSAVAAHMEITPTTFARGEEQPRPSDPSDITAQPFFSHADDYSWLCGEVTHAFHNRNAWRVRYLSVEDTDAHGGALTLIEDERLNCWKEGMYVKVWGHVDSTEDRPGTNTYRVDRFEIMPNTSTVSQQETRP
jgi:hypothetical protein